MEDSVKSYLDNYRYQNPQYNDYSDQMLYRKLSREGDATLPSSGTIRYKRPEDRDGAAYTTHSKDYSPEKMNSFGSILSDYLGDYFVNENSYDWMKAAYNQSLTGMTEQLITGKQKYDLDDYDPNILEDIGSMALSFIFPVDLLAMWVGAKIGGGVVKGLSLVDDGAKLVGHAIGKSKGFDKALKHVYKTLPMYQSGITQATTLGTYESAMSSIATATDPDSNASDIIFAGVKGFGHGAMVGGLSGLAGGALAGTSRYSKALEKFGKSGEKLKQASKLDKFGMTIKDWATGPVGQVMTESLVDTSIEIGERSILYGEDIDAKDILHAYGRNIGLFTVMKGQHSLWSSTTGKMSEALDYYRDNVSSKDKKNLSDNESLAENTRDNIDAEISKDINDSDSSPELIKHEEIVQSELNKHIENVQNKIGKEGLDADSIKREFERFERDLETLVEMEKSGGKFTEEQKQFYVKRIEDAMNILKSSIAVIDMNIKNQKSPKAKEKNLPAMKALTDKWQTDLDNLIGLHQKINDVFDGNKQFKNSNTTMRDFQDTNAKRKRLLEQLKNKKKTEKTNEYDEYIKMLEYKSAGDETLKFKEHDGENLPIDNKELFDTVEMMDRVDRVTKATQSKGIDIDSADGQKLHIKEGDLGGKKTEDIDFEIQEMAKIENDLELKRKTLKKGDEGYVEFVKERNQFESIYGDASTRKAKKEIYEAYKDIDNIIDKTDSPDKRDKLLESKEFLRDMLVNFEGGLLADFKSVEVTKRQRGYVGGKKATKLKPQGVKDKINQYKRFALFMAEQNKSIFETTRNDFQKFVDTIGTNQKWSANKNTASLNDLVRYINQQKDTNNWRGDKGEFRTYSDADLKAAEIKGVPPEGVRTGEISGLDSKVQTSIDKAGDDGYFLGNVGKAGTRIKRFIVGKAKSLWKSMRNKAKKNEAGYDDFIVTDADGKPLHTESGGDLIRLIFGEKTGGSGNEMRRFRDTASNWVKTKYGSDSIEAHIIDHFVHGRTSEADFGKMLDRYARDKGKLSTKEQETMIKDLLTEFMTDAKNGEAKVSKSRDGKNQGKGKIGKIFGNKKLGKNSSMYSLLELKEGYNKIDTDFANNKDLQLGNYRYTKKEVEFFVDLMMSTQGRMKEILPQQKTLVDFIKDYGDIELSTKSADYQLLSDLDSRIMTAREKRVLINFIEKMYPELDAKFVDKIGTFAGRDILGSIHGNLIRIAEGKASVDTLPHEISHYVFDVLEAIGDNRSRALILEGIDLFRKDVKGKELIKAKEIYAAKKELDVKKLTKNQISEAKDMHARELFIDASGKHAAKQITNKSLVGRMGAWFKKFWLNMKDTFGITNYADAQQRKSDLIFLMGEKTVKRDLPSSVIEVSFNTEVEFQLGSKAGKENFDSRALSINTLEDRLKKDFGYTAKDINKLRNKPWELGGLNTVKFNKDSDITLGAYDGYIDMLSKQISIHEANKLATKKEAENYSRVIDTEMKYNITETQRNEFFKIYGTKFGNASDLMIKHYKNWIEAGFDPIERRTTSIDNILALTENNPGLKLHQRVLMPTSHVLTNYGGKAGQQLGYKFVNFEAFENIYRGQGQAILYNIQQRIGKKGTKYLYLADRQRANSELKELKKRRGESSYAEKQYRELKTQYEKFYGNKKEGIKADLQYRLALKDWKTLTDGYWQHLEQNIRLNTGKVEGDKLVADLKNGKYINDYFVRKLSPTVLKNLDKIKNGKQFEKLVEQHMDTAARRAVSKIMSKGTKTFEKKVADWKAKQENKDKVKAQLYDMFSKGPTQLDPSFMRDRGPLLPMFMEVDGKLVRTYQTKFEDTAVNYVRGMAKYLATVKLFPEFTKLDSKVYDTKARLLESISANNEFGFYAKEAIQYKLGLFDSNNSMVGNTTQKFLSTVANVSAVLGLSSPMSGIKNLFIQIPRSVSVYGFRNTLSAMSRAGYIPFEMGRKSVKKFNQEARKKGYVGYGTPELLATEGTKYSKWYFDNVNLMTRTENFNRIVTAEAGTQLFNQLLSKYRGEGTMFRNLERSNKEIERMFNETWRLSPEEISFLGKMEQNDFNSQKYSDILHKVGHFSHVSSAGGTSVGMLPLWMSRSVAKPLTLFQRIAASVTWDSYVNYVKPIKNGNFAPILKAAIGHTISGAALYSMYDLLFDTQPPKEDSDFIDRTLMYLHRSEFFGMFGELFSPYEKGDVRMLSEPIIFRNLITAQEELSNAGLFGGEPNKTVRQAVHSLNKRTIVIYGQGVKALEKTFKTPSLNYNYEQKRRRIKSLEREWREFMLSKTGATTWVDTDIQRGTEKQIYYHNLKKAFYFGDENDIAKEYYKAFNYIIHDLEASNYTDVNEMIKAAERMIEVSIKSTNVLNVSHEKDGKSISRREQFLNYLKGDNRALALRMEKDWEKMKKAYDKIIKKSSHRRQWSVFPNTVSKKGQPSSPQRRIYQSLYGGGYDLW